MTDSVIHCPAPAKSPGLTVSKGTDGRTSVSPSAFSPRGHRASRKRYGARVCLSARFSPHASSVRLARPAELAANIVVWASIVALVACDEEAGREPTTPPLDTSPASRPDDAVAELEVDAEATLEALRAPIQDEAMRALLPARLVDLVEASVVLPGALRHRVRPERGARALAFVVDGAGTASPTVELVWAFAIEPLDSTMPGSRSAAEGSTVAEAPIATELGAPRGARWIVGEPIAIAGEIAIAGPSRQRVEAALAYLAFTAMPRAPAPANLVVTATRELLVRVLRPMADGWLAGVARDARASAEAAMRAHAEPPLLGAPDRFVDRVRARLAEFIAYLPDLSELRVALGAAHGGLALEIDGPPADGSPLAELLSGLAEGDLGSMASVPERTALAVMLRSTPDARRARSERLLADVADVAGDRLSADERAAFDATMASWDGGLGDTSLWALGRSAAGLFALVAGPDAPPAAPGDAALAPFWGPRARPYESALVGALVGCDPVEPRGAPPLALCGGARVDASRAESGPFVVAITAEDAGPIAETTLAALAASRPVLAASPDVTRALGPHAAPGFFALALIPSRVLGLLAALEHVRAPSEAPPATVVVSARRTAAGHLSILLTADAAALRDTWQGTRTWVATH